MKLYLFALAGGVVGIEQLYLIAAACALVVLSAALWHWRRIGRQRMLLAAIVYVASFLVVCEVGIRVVFIRDGRYVNLGLGGGLDGTAEIALAAFLLPLLMFWLAVRLTAPRRNTIGMDPERLLS